MPGIILNSDDSNSGGVCSVLRLYSFGEGLKAGYDRNAPVFFEPAPKTFEEFKEQCVSAAMKLDKLYPIDKASMVIAFATTLQPLAQKHLKKAGFTEFAVSQYKKYDHGISMFAINIADFHTFLGWDYSVTEIDDRKAGHFSASKFEKLLLQEEEDEDIEY